MGTFTASLRLPGDSHALAATVHLREGRLQVASGEHVIGDWDINAIDISRIPEGIRVAVDGEVLLLDIEDRSTFEEEAASLNGKKTHSRRPKKSARTEAARRPSRKSAKTVTTSAPVAEKSSKVRTESRIDLFLKSARDRFGDNVPDWVFTRGGLVAVVALLALCVVFAEVVSTLLLVAGVIALLAGGVTMLDSVIARRLLRHRVTPIQVVIGGGTIFVAGLLIGVVA
ncbi:MAG: hypothetical protein ACRDZM_09660 [Acidimicrobiia bacterium]